jgi:hypothetical protein
VTLAAAAFLAAVAFAPTASADGRDPTVSALSRYTAFKDAKLSSVSRAGDIRDDTWPFSEMTADGETVRIHLSKTLYQRTDTTVAQNWADFLDSLVHGSELATLDAYLLTLREVQNVCGPGALACYGNNEIVAPAEDPEFDLSAESVIAHEYGHHVAAHRLNNPWEAIETGTKRWASHENVCLKTRRGVYFPGAEDRQRYFYNPGEGFAEAYRVLNEHKLGVQEASWDIVTDQFYPDSTALTLLEQDVTSPWTRNTTLARSGAVSARVKSRGFVVPTLLDGRFSVRLTSSAKAKFRLDILSPTSKSLAHRSGKSPSASALVCGERALRVRVNRVSGAGAFRLAISRP